MLLRGVVGGENVNHLELVTKQSIQETPIISYLSLTFNTYSSKDFAQVFGKRISENLRDSHFKNLSVVLVIQQQRHREA